MSIFTNWSQLGEDPARNTCSPNLLALAAHLTTRHGGQVLGCYAERNIRGGQSPSAHSHGAALDWRYENPGPGRPAALAIAQWVIDHHAVLGVQAIHDYVGGRIWHSDRNAWKNAARRSDGTYTDPNMGHAWAQWFHFETTLAAWADARPIADRLTPNQEDNDMANRPAPEVIRHGPIGATYVAIDGHKFWIDDGNAAELARQRFGTDVRDVGEVECVSYGPILGPTPPRTDQFGRYR